MISAKQKRPLHFRHILALVFTVFPTLTIVYLHYSFSEDIAVALVEGLFFIFLEIFLWRRWVRKDRVAEEKAEEMRKQKLEELTTRKEKPVEFTMKLPLSKIHIVISGIVFISLPIFIFFVEGGLIGLILMLLGIPFGIAFILSIHFIEKTRFAIDSWGMRRTRILLKDFYLPWYSVRKITAKDMSYPFIPRGPKNYVLIAKTDKGKKRFLMTSLAIGEDKFMQLYYDIIPYLKNRNIEFEDELGWAKRQCNLLSIRLNVHLLFEVCHFFHSVGTSVIKLKKS